MTKDQYTTATNLAYEHMLQAQSMLDYAETEREKMLAKAIYELSWIVWTVLDAERKKKH